ncbi:MAG TPA: D-sedoheptulose 7-phosphate isomerase [Chromatiaceae bacterium]|nr:D-sedoheptulose 7-phosphate isomerase [Chromatiaceae bacterium]
MTSGADRTPAAIIARHLADHQRTIAALGDLTADLERIAARQGLDHEGGGRIFWLGNGGSAADSQHLASELVGRFERERPGLAAIALTTDSSALTAIGNDYGFEQVFARQVEALCRPGDLVIGISTSGNSPNVLRALERARTLGITTAAFSGRDGGRLKDLVEACLIAPADNTARIQEAHLLAGHILCELVEAHFSTVVTAPDSSPALPVSQPAATDPATPLPDTTVSASPGPTLAATPSRHAAASGPSSAAAPPPTASSILA